MSQNLADGLRADRAPGTVGAARRRRDRRLRAFLKHKRLAVAMNLATIQHHSHMWWMFVCRWGRPWLQ